MRRGRTLAWVVALAACQDRPDPPGALTLPPRAPPGGQAAVARAPEDVLRRAFQGLVVRLGPMVWQGPLGPRLAAVMADDVDVPLLAWVTPGTDGGTGSTTLPLASTTRAWVLRDVNSDGRPELLLWTGPARMESSTLHTTLLAYGDPPGAPQAPQEMPWVEAALVGVTTEAALDAALPRLNTFEPPDATVATERLIVRLPLATAEAFRAMVAPGGLRLCRHLDQDARPHGARCVLFLPDQVTDTVWATQVRPALGRFRQYRAVEDPAGAMLPPGPCQHEPAGDVCTATERGPAGVRWTFVGTGSQRRLSEVLVWTQRP